MYIYKTHLVFCCDHGCKEHGISRIMENNASIRRGSDSVTLGNDRYVFFIDINKRPNDLEGWKFDDWRCCEEYELSMDVMNMLQRGLSV
jgi:hypothetical protein